MLMLINSVSSQISFTYSKVENPSLVEYAQNKLPNHGYLKWDKNESYIYLKVDDTFIYDIFPLLTESNIIIPNYFSANNSIGAHISFLYPNEPNAGKITQEINSQKVKRVFSFAVLECIRVTVFDKIFFALVVSAPELEAFRLQLGLGMPLNYQGLLVPFHITIAVGDLSNGIL